MTFVVVAIVFFMKHHCNSPFNYFQVLEKGVKNIKVLRK